MKKLLPLLLALILLFSLTTTAYASNDAEEAPSVTTEDFNYFIYVTNALVIESGTANCGASANCLSSVDRIDMSMYLQKYDGGWVTIKYWTNRTNSDYATISGQWSVSSGYTYRNRCFYYAYIDGVCVESTITNNYESY